MLVTLPMVPKTALMSHLLVQAKSIGRVIEMKIAILTFALKVQRVPFVQNSAKWEDVQMAGTAEP